MKALWDKSAPVNMLVMGLDGMNERRSGYRRKKNQNSLFIFTFLDLYCVISPYMRNKMHG